MTMSLTYHASLGQCSREYLHELLNWCCRLHDLNGRTYDNNRWRPNLQWRTGRRDRRASEHQLLLRIRWRCHHNHRLHSLNCFSLLRFIFSALAA